MSGTKNIYTLGKLKKFLSTLSAEQLKQPVHIAFEDCPIQDLWGHEVTKEDIYRDKNDHEVCGTLKDLLNDPTYIKSDLILSTPKGTVLFF